MIKIVLFFLVSYELFSPLVGTLPKTRTTNTTLTTTTKTNVTANITNIIKLKPKPPAIDPLRLSSRSPSPNNNNNKKIIYFLHIHKSGGSTLCKQAQLQRLKTSSHNCNVQNDKNCCGNEDSMEAQIIYAKETRYELVACEKEMYDAMATDYYDYVVTLRDSMSRYFSHWRHVRSLAELNPLFNKEKTKTDGTRSLLSQSQSQVVRAMSTKMKYSSSLRKQQLKPKIVQDINDVHEKYIIQVRTSEDNNMKTYPVGNFNIWLDYQPDNYSTRMICGSRCKNVSKFQLTPDLLEHTLKRLSLFSHIMFLEDMENTYNTFTKAMGWKNRKITHENRNKMTILSRNTTALSEMKMTADTNNSSISINTVYDPFMTVLDDALYEFARRKYDSKNNNKIATVLLSWEKEQFNNQEIIQQYFQNGYSRNCTNPCCGECSKWR